MTMHEPVHPPAAVPDDRVHGDSLPGAEPYGDSWLRPTLGPPQPEGLADTPAAASAPTAPSATSAPAAVSSRPWWLVAGLGATLVLAGIAGVTTWGAATGGLWRSADQQQTYAQPIGALTIQGGASDVQVRGGGAAGTVHVSRHLSWGPGSGGPTPREFWSGSTLAVDASCTGSFGGCSVDYVITVPDTTDVTVVTGSGDIAVGGSLGGVALKAGSGDIRTTNLAADQVTAEDGSGDVDLELATAPPTVGVRTGSGDVSVRLPPNTHYAVDSATGSGDTKVRVTDDPASTSRLRIRSGSGDVTVDDR